MYPVFLSAHHVGGKSWSFLSRLIESDADATRRKACCLDLEHSLCVTGCSQMWLVGLRIGAIWWGRCFVSCRCRLCCGEVACLQIVSGASSRGVSCQTQPPDFLHCQMQVDLEQVSE
mmetsp:Transcript_2458/g.7215  ORF Transcript_2458/g.7215 Transcript_2458/m.7215 type:complete len:117 (-) Transcript_2458:6-356(-)